MKKNISANALNFIRRTGLLFAAAAVSLSIGVQASSPLADVVFFSNNVITMAEGESRQAKALAVAVANGRIIWVGAQAQAAEHIGDDTQLIKLGDKALLPGFKRRNDFIAKGRRASTEEPRRYSTGRKGAAGQ